jgi:hypothetical protein
MSAVSASALDEWAVAQLILHERQASDRGWHDQMGAAYWPDSTVSVTWYSGDGPGYAVASRGRFQGGNRAQHHPFAPVVRVRGDRAHAELSMLNWSTCEVQGKRCDLNTYMRLNYRVERRDAEWRILSLDVIYEFSRITPSAPGQSIEIPEHELAQYRPAYALLAWRLSQTGVTVSNHELGEDRPGEVAAFYSRIEEWLNGRR